MSDTAMTPIPRGFRVEQVTGPLPADVAADVAALARQTEAADDVAPLSEAAMLALTDPQSEVTHLLASPADGGKLRAFPADGGTLLGYAALDRSNPDDPTLHLLVGPAYRRRSIGTALLARARAIAPVSIWAHGALPAAEAFATRHGLGVVRELWLMRREPSDKPAQAPPAPAGVTIRAFRPGEDEQAWLAVNARAFADHPEQARMTLHDLLAREREDWFDPAGLLLAESDGALLGSVWTKIHPAASGGPAAAGGPALGESAAAAGGLALGESASVGGPAFGELYVVGVDPAQHGRGLGRLLAEHGLAHLRERGVGAVILYAGPENAVAVRLYRGLGFETVGTDIQYR